MRIAEALLPEFDVETAGGRRVLERIPAAKFTFKPHPKSTDMRGLATHLGGLLEWTESILNEDSFDVAKPFQPFVPASTEELLTHYDGAVKRARAALETTPDERFFEPWSLKQGETVLFTMKRIAVVRSYVMNHFIHHRAQLTVYLRLNDIPVPGLYGPSADESF